jgi:restriction system protein
MSRRNGGLTEWLEAASKLPWQVSVALALGAFIAFHFIAVASAHTAAVSRLSEIRSVAIRAYIHTFATLLQFIVPVVFLAPAAMALARRSRSRALLDAARSGAAASIARLSLQDFMTLVGEGFRHRGFSVTKRGGAEPDGGIDLVLTRGHERFLVQCKQWNAQSVSVSVVRELHGAMTAEGAVGGFAVTLGAFSVDSKRFASGRNIELIDGGGLGALFSGSNGLH